MVSAALGCFIWGVDVDMMNAMEQMLDIVLFEAGPLCIFPFRTESTINGFSFPAIESRSSGTWMGASIFSRPSSTS